MLLGLQDTSVLHILAWIYSIGVKCSPRLTRYWCDAGFCMWRVKRMIYWQVLARRQHMTILAYWSACHTSSYTCTLPMPTGAGQPPPRPGPATPHIYSAPMCHCTSKSILWIEIRSGNDRRAIIYSARDVCFCMISVHSHTSSHYSVPGNRDWSGSPSKLIVYRAHDFAIMTTFNPNFRAMYNLQCKTIGLNVPDLVKSTNDGIE